MMMRRVSNLAVKCGALQAQRLQSAAAVSQVQLTRCFSDKKQPIKHEVQDDVYNKPQGFTIRVMFGISTVNLMYWSSILLNHYWFKGMVVSGIDLAGDPLWGYVGCFATSGFLFFTRHFAHHTIGRAYLVEEGKRLRLQVHTMLGTPGKTYEVAPNLVRFVSDKQKTEVLSELAQDKLAEKAENPSFATRVLESSFVPLRITGVDSNFVVDKYGLKDFDQRFAQMVAGNQGDVQTMVQAKEERINYYKNHRRSKK